MYTRCQVPEPPLWLVLPTVTIRHNCCDFPKPLRRITRLDMLLSPAGDFALWPHLWGWLQFAVLPYAGVCGTVTECVGALPVELAILEGADVRVTSEVCEGTLSVELAVQEVAVIHG